LWFLDQLQGPSPVYNMAVAVRLDGRLDADALGAALADVVGRHESLRTLFPTVEGIPRQRVVPAERADFGWGVLDAAGVWGGAVGGAGLFRAAGQAPVGVPTVPHTAADGWSISPLLGDLGGAYARRCVGQAPG